MKILAIGNSFSQDATAYLQAVARSAGTELFVRNIYIGGCSLERHAANIKSGEEVYEYQENAVKIRMISIGEALEAEEWDHITIQQQSMRSGFKESYEPFISEVLAYIRLKCPKAKIAFHMTWQYEKGFGNENFAPFDYDRDKMYSCIVDATDEVSAKHGLPLIKVGDAIHRAVETALFDPEKGGVSVYRDGFHLSIPYGRYLAALVWFEFFTGKDAAQVKFVPDGASEELVCALKKLTK